MKMDRIQKESTIHLVLRLRGGAMQFFVRTLTGTVKNDFSNILCENLQSHVVHCVYSTVDLTQRTLRILFEIEITFLLLEYSY